MGQVLRTRHCPACSAADTAKRVTDGQPRGIFSPTPAWAVAGPNCPNWKCCSLLTSLIGDCSFLRETVNTQDGPAGPPQPSRLSPTCLHCNPLPGVVPKRGPETPPRRGICSPASPLTRLFLGALSSPSLTPSCPSLTPTRPQHHPKRQRTAPIKKTDGNKGQGGCGETGDLGHHHGDVSCCGLSGKAGQLLTKLTLAA